MNGKIFILGVGCQKGGTTWLYHQLAKHSSIDMGFVKEYHVFDALHLDKNKIIIGNKLSNLEKTLKNDQLMSDRNDNLLRHIDFYRNIDNYYEYFHYLLLKSPQTTIVGDITPAYSGLSADTYMQIKQRFEKLGVTVKVVFIMRDPIERIWSHMRMDRRNRMARGLELSQMLSAQEEIMECYNNEGVEIRTRYEKTIKNIDLAFEAENVFYGLYENLFTQETISRLERFLGISNLAVDFNTRFNASPKEDGVLSSEICQHIASYYKATYECCSERFSACHVWNGYRYL